jgi:hypothetical protein
LLFSYWLKCSDEHKPDFVHVYEVPPPKDRRGFDLISEALPFGRLWYQHAGAAIGYAKFYSRSQPGEVRVFEAAGAMISAENWPGDFHQR